MKIIVIEAEIACVAYGLGHGPHGTPFWAGKPTGDPVGQEASGGSKAEERGSVGGICKTSVLLLDGYGMRSVMDPTYLR